MNFEIGKDYQVEGNPAVYRYVYSDGKKVFKWIADPNSVGTITTVQPTDVSGIEKYNPQTGSYSKFENVTTTTTPTPPTTANNKMKENILKELKRITNIGDKVDYIYNTILGRLPDTGGKEYYTKIIKADPTAIDFIIDGFLNSDEYKKKPTPTTPTTPPETPTNPPTTSDKPANWDSLTVEGKANLIKEQGITNLQSKDWWSNDPDKNAIWEKIQETTTETQTPGGTTPVGGNENIELSPDNWNNMTKNEKAKYIIDNGLINLKDKDWWNNDPDKVAIFNLIKEYNNVTSSTPTTTEQRIEPKLLFDMIKSGQVAPGADNPEWNKYSYDDRKEAYDLWTNYQTAQSATPTTTEQRIEPQLLLEMIKKGEVTPGADNPEWNKYNYEDRKIAYDLWSKSQIGPEVELSPDNWDNMTAIDKAKYIWNNGLKDLKGKAWWDNDPDKVAIYDLVKEYNNVTPESLAQNFAGQTNLTQDPDWIKYPMSLREQAWQIMSTKTVKESMEEDVEGKLAQQEQTIAKTKEDLLAQSQKIMDRLDIYKAEQKGLIDNSYNAGLNAIKNMKKISADKKKLMFDSLKIIKKNKQNTLKTMIDTVKKKYSFRIDLLEGLKGAKSAQIENTLRARGIDMDNPLALQNIFAQQDIAYDNQIKEANQELLSQLLPLQQELGNAITEQQEGMMGAEQAEKDALINYQQAISNLTGTKAEQESALGSTVLTQQLQEDAYGKAIIQPDLDIARQTKSGLEQKQSAIITDEYARQQQIEAEKRAEEAQKRLMTEQAKLSQQYQTADPSADYYAALAAESRAKTKKIEEGVFDEKTPEE